MTIHIQEMNAAQLAEPIEQMMARLKGDSEMDLEECINGLAKKFGWKSGNVYPPPGFSFPVKSKDELRLVAETPHIRWFVLSKVNLPTKKNYKIAAGLLCDFIIGSKSKLAKDLYFST